MMNVIAIMQKLQTHIPALLLWSYRIRDAASVSAEVRLLPCPWACFQLRHIISNQPTTHRQTYVFLPSLPSVQDGPAKERKHTSALAIADSRWCWFYSFCWVKCVYLEQYKKGAACISLGGDGKTRPFFLMAKPGSCCRKLEARDKCYQLLLHYSTGGEPGYMAATWSYGFHIHWVHGELAHLCPTLWKMGRFGFLLQISKDSMEVSERSLGSFPPLLQLFLAQQQEEGSCWLRQRADTSGTCSACLILGGSAC